MTEDTAIATIRYAVKNGITLLDTAPFYGNGQSELRVGLAIGDIPRDQLIISSKVGWLPDTTALGQQGVGTRSYSRDSVLRSVEHSLKRLCVDYLDIAHVHDPENGNHRDEIEHEAYATLIELKEQGVIRAIGAGLNETGFLVKFMQKFPLDCAILAGRYTLLEHTPAHEAFLTSAQKNIPIFAAGIFNGGILATGAVSGARYQYRRAPEPILRLTRRIEAACTRYGVPLRAAALQFVAAHPAVRALVVGMVKPAEVDENFENLRLPIPPTFWAELRVREIIDPGVPTPGQIGIRQSNQVIGNRANPLSKNQDRICSSVCTTPDS